ncbi:hypothetical protein ZRA01_15280 [Zoogloea ramigera]|uniref:DUF802 domain-containing protein n=1 Tax=Zoogloea ramigera TaxID=350 RepID=A0A4Y4CR63_ZOORA|nr:DUF802 domain-containing protein [Zoogloea ramigera]GEC95455.1 hypothetical protein ZRA01_15280 [Zoogloea ramigera]
MNRTLTLTAFLLGLLAVGWVGAGYIGHSPLALTMTALIGVVYLAGGLELLRFQQATASLARALEAIPDELASLGDWLGKVHPSLHNAVRLRIEGERSGLPGPTMAPYLVGLLVLLGMLGTFLGMVVTLNGAVLALESTTDLHTIRAALAAPVKGLGVAFGTSVAGVAASAMLGLVSTLCRRQRLLTGQQLDTRIAGALRGFSLGHQRQEAFKAIQAQAQALPEVVNTLQTMMAQLERHNQQLGERLLAGQESHYREAKGLYTELATSVDQSLRDSLSHSARLAGEAIQPVVEATMGGIARETSSLRETLTDTVKAQLDGLAGRFDSTVNTVADTWTAALARHEHTSDALQTGLDATLGRFTDTFEARSASLLASVEHTHARLQTELAGTLAGLTQATQASHSQLADKVEAQLDSLAERFGTTVTTVADTWTAALARHEQTSDALARDTRESLAAFVDKFDRGAAAQLDALHGAHAALQAELAARDAQRLTGMGEALEALAASLQQHWLDAGNAAEARQAEICRTLDETARSLSASTQAEARHTIAEVERLMLTAAEAPRAAAEVIGQLRHELSASIARDNSLLEERSRIMETLASLLDGINHASTEQKSAIDALVTSSASLLERVGKQFEARTESESTRLAEAAAQIAGGAVEVASLSEAFGFAVERFGESNQQLTDALSRIEAALAQSMSRSDEQLAYYVAQAREIIDLSIMSQRQIVDDLQQLPARQAAQPSEA